ncbi:hypothetical protein [Streptomyces sp. SYSU K217416]
MTRARAWLLLPVLLLAASCAEPPSPVEQYREGYHYGRGDGGPDGHVDDTPAPADPAAEDPAGDEDSAADSECGEHAESDGIQPFPPSKDWMAGCRDGALGRPSAEDRY